MTKQIASETKQNEEKEAEKSVLCRNCGLTITERSFATQPHEHTFRNPAGYSYHVVCYSEAPGAADAGDPTTEASWFPGYAWSFALCKECHNHIGWWYIGKSRFAGLIATRLIR